MSKLLAPNVIIGMDYEIPTKVYALGKTPLSVRVARFVDWHTFITGSKPIYIPIHPKEYAQLADKASFTGIVLAWGTRYQMLPLGMSTTTRTQQEA